MIVGDQYSGSPLLILYCLPTRFHGQIHLSKPWPVNKRYKAKQVLDIGRNNNTGVEDLGGLYGDDSMLHSVTIQLRIGPNLQLLHNAVLVSSHRSEADRKDV